MQSDAVDALRARRASKDVQLNWSVNRFIEGIDQAIQFVEEQIRSQQVSMEGSFV
jgi:hypothetical protein